MRLKLADIESCKVDDESVKLDLQPVDAYSGVTSSFMGQTKGSGDTEKSTLSENLVAAWLKYDPFVKLVAKDDNTIRYEAMLAMAGEKAAKKFFGTAQKYNPPPELIYPRHVREKEAQFLEEPDKRTHIVRELVYWGRDEYLNQENPESHVSRVQIIQSLLGPLFVSANESQEKLIVDGVKVLVVSRETGGSKSGEQSPLVHQEILAKVGEILRYDLLVQKNKADDHAQKAIRAHLIKTIQGLKETTHRSAYYLADDSGKRRRAIASKFPLRQETRVGLIDIVRHYSFSASPQINQPATRLLAEVAPEEKKLPID